MPPTEPTKTIRPPALRISGSAACVTATCPTTLTSSWRRSASSGSASSGPGTPMPALLTTRVEAVELREGARDRRLAS